MPPEARTFGLVRFIFVTVLLPAIVLLIAYFGRNYAQRVNQRLSDPEARSYFRSWVPIPTVRERPTFSKYSILRFAINRYPHTGDPFLFQLTSHVKAENFDLSSQGDSSDYIIPEITNVSPNAKRILGGRDFASLFDFCRELLVYGAFDDEKRVLLKYWEHVAKKRESVAKDDESAAEDDERAAEDDESTAEDNESTAGDNEGAAEDDERVAAQQFDDYVRYVVSTYTVPALLLFKERRVSRAEDLLSMACERLQFIHMTPLQFEGTTFALLRDRTFILAALLEDGLNTALHYDKIDEAVTCLIDGLPGLARNEWAPDKSGETTAINSFMAGLYLLDELRYDECMAQTANTLAAHPPPRLLHLTLRIQLQCELRRRERSQVSKASASLIDLKRIYTVLDKSPYSSELKYYKHKLGDPLQ